MRLPRQLLLANGTGDETQQGEAVMFLVGATGATLDFNQVRASKT